MSGRATGEREDFRFCDTCGSPVDLIECSLESPPGRATGDVIFLCAECYEAD